MKKLASWTLLVVVLIATAKAQKEVTYREYADAAANVDKFNGAILVKQNGKTVFEQAYGLADREKKIPNTTATKFYIGSMTKSFTATAVMILRDQGKLSVDDPLCKFVSPCPEAWKPIQLKQMLNHTAGLPDVTKYPDYMDFRQREFTPQQIVELIAARPLDFTPGAKFQYSNSNFMALGYVIEKASGITYEAFLRKYIFDPAGMKESGYLARTPGPLAKGYMRDGDNYRAPDPSTMSLRFSAGGLYSTVSDIDRFAQALLAGKIVRPTTLTEMWTDRGNGYGYGWMASEEKGRRSYGHNGRVDGYTASFQIFPEEKLFVAVMSNVNGTGSERMASTLASIAHSEPFKMPHVRKFISVPEATLAQYDGHYKLPWGLVLVVTHEGDKLIGRAAQEKKFTEWKAESATKFYVAAADIEITFEKDASGKITLDFDGAGKAERQ